MTKKSYTKRLSRKSKRCVISGRGPPRRASLGPPALRVRLGLKFQTVAVYLRPSSLRAALRSFFLSFFSGCLLLLLMTPRVVTADSLDF